MFVSTKINTKIGTRIGSCLDTHSNWAEKCLLRGSVYNFYRRLFMVAAGAFCPGLGFPRKRFIPKFQFRYLYIFPRIQYLASLETYLLCSWREHSSHSVPFSINNHLLSCSGKAEQPSRLSF